MNVDCTVCMHFVLLLMKNSQGSPVINLQTRNFRGGSFNIKTYTFYSLNLEHIDFPEGPADLNSSFFQYKHN